jgi:hypothetical protein
MPYDLNAIERGYGEAVVDWQGHEITVRYRADLNNRALIAMKRVMIGVTALDGVTKFPDVEAIIDELLRVLLPSGPDVPEEERGWDLTDNGRSVPITWETLVDLPPGLPAALLGGIFRDVNDPLRRKLSSSGWSRTAGSESSPTTSASSRTRNGQASLPGPSEALNTPVTGAVGVSGSGRSGTPRSERRTS